MPCPSLPPALASTAAPAFGAGGASHAVFVQTDNTWRRLVIHLTRRLVRGDIFIPDNVLPMPPAELVKTMRRLHRTGQRRAHGGGAGRRA